MQVCFLIDNDLAATHGTFNIEHFGSMFDLIRGVVFRLTIVVIGFIVVIFTFTLVVMLGADFGTGIFGMRSTLRRDCARMSSR
jgi:hypothetical protein